jgi:acetyltransferase
MKTGRHPNHSDFEHGADIKGWSLAQDPKHVTRHHRLLDGRAVTIRPIRPDDDVGERDFLNRLSGESRYLRFHEWVRAPSDRLVHFLTDIDYDRHMAYVCTVTKGDREELVGEARYVVNPDGRGCEFGVMIADEWHKTGVAGLLMEVLIEDACAKGLASMEGLVLRSNTAMLRFARALGFEIRNEPDDPYAVRVVKQLQCRLGQR